jgi:hypothetical protein
VSAQLGETVDLLAATPFVQVAPVLQDPPESLSHTVVGANSTLEDSMAAGIVVDVDGVLVELPSVPIAATTVVTVSTIEEPLAAASPLPWVAR